MVRFFHFKKIQQNKDKTNKETKKTISYNKKLFIYEKSNSSPQYFN
jgi:hypothetical protein